MHFPQCSTSPLWPTDPHQDPFNPSEKGDVSEVKDRDPVPWNVRNPFSPPQICPGPVSAGRGGHNLLPRKVLLDPSPGLPLPSIYITKRGGLRICEDRSQFQGHRCLLLHSLCSCAFLLFILISILCIYVLNRPDICMVQNSKDIEGYVEKVSPHPALSHPDPPPEQPVLLVSYASSRNHLCLYQAIYIYLHIFPSFLQKR